MNKQSRTAVIPALAKKISLLIILGLVYYVTVSKTGYGIPCIFYKFTGLKCPGCGMTRAAVCIMRGDFAAAYQYNVLSLTLIPVLCFYLVYREVRKKSEKLFQKWEYVLIALMFIFTVIYFLVRNKI